VKFRLSQSLAEPEEDEEKVVETDALKEGAVCPQAAKGTSTKAVRTVNKLFFFISKPPKPAFTA
jgi:hypothetical protein